MPNDQLKQTTKDIVAKTILAADESTGTIKKRFATIGVESNPEINRQYRQLLFTAERVENYVSGVILYDETLRQAADDGVPFPTLLAKKGIVPGIKVDKGTLKIPGRMNDTFTQGLDDLGKRLSEYKELGARFAKWRSVFTISGDSPSELTIKRNSDDLALYALLCQEAGIVPIVEPEVLMEGEHSLELDKEITEKVLATVFQKLRDYAVVIQEVILKPNMITAGKNNSNQATVETVAQETLEALSKTVPMEVPGIAFLSGGQSPDLATQHLNSINKIRNSNQSKYPWRTTASYGRALQGEALEAWAGKKENISAAQKIFIARAEKVYKASLGQL